MLVTLSAIQLILGLCEPILEDVTTDLSYIVQGWCTHIRRQLKRMKAKMWIDRCWVPKLQCYHEDVFKCPRGNEDRHVKIKSRSNVYESYLVIRLDEQQGDSYPR